LERLGLPATEANAAAMLRALGASEDASIAYGHFRRFAVLIPGEQLLSGSNANITWFESATCVPLGSTRLPDSCQILKCLRRMTKNSQAWLGLSPLRSTLNRVIEYFDFAYSMLNLDVWASPPHLGPGLYIANFECRDSRLICKICGGQSLPLSPFL
jgi:hypothetical protein